MHYSKHCELCDHRETDFKVGISCGITKRKPHFSGVCTTISLTNKFEEKLIDVYYQYQSQLRMKSWTYTYFGVFSLIAAAVIYLGYAVGTYMLGNRVISTIPLLIMVVGIVVFGMGIGAYNKFNREFSSAKDKKQDLEKILEAYHIPCDITIDFKNKYHGKQEIDVRLNLQGKRINQTFLKDAV